MMSVSCGFSNPQTFGFSEMYLSKPIIPISMWTICELVLRVMGSVQEGVGMVQEGTSSSPMMGHFGNVLSSFMQCFSCCYQVPIQPINAPLSIHPNTQSHTPSQHILSTFCGVYYQLLWRSLTWCGAVCLTNPISNHRQTATKP